MSVTELRITPTRSVSVAVAVAVRRPSVTFTRAIRRSARCRAREVSPSAANTRRLLTADPPSTFIVAMCFPAQSGHPHGTRSTAMFHTFASSSSARGGLWIQKGRRSMRAERGDAGAVRHGLS